MKSAKILIEDHEVDSKLASFEMTKSELLRIVHQAVMARNESVDNDPNNAAGLLGYIYGTREIREVYLPKGWYVDRTDNIESTVNPETGMKLIYQNTDSACDIEHIPNPISKKGKATARMIDDANYYLFPDMEEEALRRLEQTVWFLCVSINDEEVCAELLRPRAIENNQFKDFIERIFLVKPGEWGGINMTDKDYDADDGVDDIEVKVTRK